jgi:hypothetical protein
VPGRHLKISHLQQYLNLSGNFFNSSDFKSMIMTSRRQFMEQGSLGFFSTLLFPLQGLSTHNADFEGLVVNEDEGEAIQMRDGTAIIKIKLAKVQGANSIAFLSESFRPGDALPVHKHLNEDELIFLHKGSGLFTLGDKQY